MATKEDTKNTVYTKLEELFGETIPEGVPGEVLEGIESGWDNLATAVAEVWDTIVEGEGARYALLAGRSGGQTLKGDTASGGNLTLMSTAHATKGKILFGTSVYDEVNNYLGIGVGASAPVAELDIKASDPTIVLQNSSGANQTDTGVISFYEDASAGLKVKYDGNVNELQFIGRSSSTDSIRMRLSRDGGDLGIGTGYTPNYRLEVYDNGASYAVVIRNVGDNASYNGQYIQCGKYTPASNGDCKWIYFADGDNDTRSLIQYVTTSPYAAFAATSDERIKKNIKPSTVDALSIINALELYEFDFREGHKHPRQNIAFVAQQALAVYPAMVGVPEDPDEMLTVADGILIPVLTKALQELSERVNALEVSLNV